MGTQMKSLKDIVLDKCKIRDNTFIIRLVKNIVVIISSVLFVQSCSVLKTDTVYQVSEIWQKSDENIYIWKHSYDDYIRANNDAGININNDIVRMDMMPEIKFIINSCFVSDSIKIYLPFIRSYGWFIGLPYLPIIPFVTELFDYFENNKNTDYYIMISLGQLEYVMKYRDFKFFKNKKEVIPIQIEEIEFLPKREHQDIYAVKSKWTGDSLSCCELQPNKTYLIIFSLNKNTLKSIEILYKNELFINIKRKKKFGHELIP